MQCWNGGTHEKLVKFAILALASYGVGVPALIAWVLWHYRHRIRDDQRRWLIGEGNDDRNPNYSIRRRFAKLYQVCVVVMLFRLALLCVHMSRSSRRGRTTNLSTTRGAWHCSHARCTAARVLCV